jgi:integrase
VSVPRAIDKRPVGAGAALPVAYLARIVRQRLADQGALAPVSLIRVSELIQGFANFLTASEVEAAAAISEAHACAFVRSLTRSGSEPSLATMHFRRSALRIFFRETKALGVLPMDLTSDIALPPRSYRDLRPLTDEEVGRGRSFAEGALGDPRYATAWALAEATARLPELGAVRRQDVDLEGGRVWITGSSKTRPRWSTLTSWGIDQLERHVSAKPKPPRDHPLLLPGTGSRSSVHEFVASTLRHAGLSRKPGVRASSIPAWRGAKELANGASIDEVAVLLGMRSLDRVAAFIGFDWRAEP